MWVIECYYYSALMNQINWYPLSNILLDLNYVTYYIHSYTVDKNRKIVRDPPFIQMEFQFLIFFQKVRILIFPIKGGLKK